MSNLRAGSPYARDMRRVKRSGGKESGEEAPKKKSRGFPARFRVRGYDALACAST